MSEHRNNEHSQIKYPYPGLKALEKLVGTWKVTGSNIDGQVSFEWMEGGYFLIQHFNLFHHGRHIKGMEMIGYTMEFGAESPSEHIKSRIFDNQGSTYEYTYEVNDNSLTIWGGDIGSPAYYQGLWSDNGNTNSGSWIYPGGGYDSTMTRISSEEQ
ncbi:hypothetical protein [Cohnella silvisoli]|uniref:DUF1579 domain-containing protein n=1 Tax=Cohnella silvisoli TaxID=2873699 RepID=A0ABV1KPA3_9BACL|nr:hypothetical protein [Cohnella silvisoli]MCD9025590.1 hypothetical protein [Cohnella silvisoli]